MSETAMSGAELERWLARAVADLCGVAVEEVEVDRVLADYGVSSRDTVELAGRLEDLLDRTLPSTLLWDHPTIRQLAAALLPGAMDAPDAPEAPIARPSAPREREPVAVIGLGCRLPGHINGPEDFWGLLDRGGDAVGEVPARRWLKLDAAADVEVLKRTTRAGGFLDDIAGFDAEFFGISAREAQWMDPQQRMVLEVGWEALQHAAIAPESLRGGATGVFVGISASEYGHRSLSELAAVDAWSGTGGALSVAANRLSYALDLRGPSVAVDAACSSSLVAVHLGMQSLASGESDLVIAAGTNILLGPAVTAAFHEMGVISPTGHCRPFSASADGIVRAEGAGVVVLKRLSDARRDGDRVLAVLPSSAINQDGRSNGITAPNVEAQEALLRTAYGAAAIDPSEVDYVEAHGTGTLLGDPIEARALGAVFSARREESRPLLVGSVKSNVGHLEAAAGIVGLIKTVLAIGAQRIPASLHYAEGHPHIDFEGLRLAVADRATDWPDADRPARAGVSAFGFGGTNAHVIVEQAPPAPAPAPGIPGEHGPIGRFVLAGADASRVRDSAGELADWLEGDGSTARLCDVELTLARRLSGRARAGVVARDRASLIAGLRACADGGRSPNVVDGRAGRVDAAPVWVFSGQGSQWAGMGLRLMQDEPEFAAALRELDALILPEAGFSVCAELERGEEVTAIERLQPVLFAVQVALSRLLEARGLRPAAVIGHSLGEVAAAVVVGALSAADGARVVALRSRLLATLAGTGAMALLELSADEVAEALGASDAVEVAAFNAPTQVAVAGAPAQVTELVAAVEARGRLAKLIKSTVAGHCRLVDPVVGALTEGLRGLRPQAAHTPFYSTVLDDPRAMASFDAGYWAQNIRRPVRFAQAVTAAAAYGHVSFVEIAPHAVLFHALTDNARAGGVEQPLVLSTGRRCDDETAHLHAQLTALLLNGGTLPAVARGDARLVDLPRTRWRHTRHWLEPRARGAAVAAHPLLGNRIELPGETRRAWQYELDRVDPLTAGADRWMMLPTWLEIAHAAATEGLGAPAGAVLLSDVVLHAPLALGDRITLSTSLELTAPRAGRLTVHSRIGRSAWRTHLSATIEAVAQPVAPAPARFAAPIHMVLAAAPAEEGSRSAVAGVQQALKGLMDSLGAADDGAWLARSVNHAHWFGSLDEVKIARMAWSECSGADERTATLQLTDAEGLVRLELGAIKLSRVAPADLPMALPEKLLRHDWQAVAAPATAALRGSWLVVGDPSDPRAGELAGGLRFRGAEAGVVSASEADGALRDDRTVGGVVMLAAPAPPDEDPEDAPGRGARLVLDGARLVLALSERPGVDAARTRLWFVTTGAAAVVAGDEPDPGPAALRGLVRVLAYEHPELQPRWVDLEPGREVEDLLGELGLADREDEVAWRAGRRHVARLVRPQLDELTSETASTVCADGAYLISGGLGGLGLVLARWLAESGAARVVLNGRSAPGLREQRAIAELRELGSEIVVVNGDIAVPGVAEQAVAACTAPGARMRGVIHAAAVMQDTVTVRLDADSLHRVWAAKATGAWRLSVASTGVELDWWVGFSSAAALIGSPGQAAYAAANAYLDALTASRRARGMVATTVNWGTWSQVGQAAERSADAVSQITPAEGLEALEALLAAEMPAAGVLRLDPVALAEAFPALVDIPLLSHVLDAARTASARASAVWPGVAALDPAEAHALVDDRVNERIAAVLGAGPGSLDADAPLTTLGLDSLLAMRIRNAVQHDFEVLLPPGLLLRGASINEVLSWLCNALHILEPASVPESLTRPRSARVPPRDASERMVAAVWEEVLGRSGIGVTQHFFDALGGDQSAADRVSEMLARRSSQVLLVSELFAEPTIERQAALLREPESTSSTPRRLLRAGDPSEHLFLFHPGGGDTLVYRQLVEQLDQRFTVWGMDRLEGVLSVEERAEHYVELVRETQPDGPYLLAGWSFGGALAYETGLRLQAAGEKLELLALIDTLLPLPDPPGHSDAQVVELRFLRFAEFIELSYGKPISLPFERMASLDDEAQADVMTAAIVDAGLIDPAANAAIILHQRTSYLDVRALERYRPARVEGPVVLYSARDAQPGGIRDPRFDRQDAARGWDAVCGDQLDIVRVAGHHLSLLDPPNVDAIATHINWLLDELRRVAA